MTTSISQQEPKVGVASFEPVEGGYLFATANPWIFGPTRNYIVTEAQRSALLDVMSVPRPGLRLALMGVAIIVFTVVVSLLWWLFSGHENPTGSDLAGMVVTLLGPLYLAAVVLIRGHLRRIAPILAAAVPTTARLTPSKRGAIPTKLLNVAIAFWVIAAAIQVTLVAMHPTVFNVGAAAFAALFAAYLARQRWQRDAS